jgi:hypothetical protein
MKKRLAAVGVVIAAAALAAIAATGALGGRDASGTILIGISAAKTGILAPYDLQSGQLFEMRIAQINKKGGVLGKQIKVQWIDTKSDKPTAATNAEELISKGAVAIIATCDFDYSFPAINAARGHKVPGIRALRLVAEGSDAGNRGPVRGLDGPRLRYRGIDHGGVDARKEAAVEACLRLQGHRPSSTPRRPLTTSRHASPSSAARSAARTRSSAARTST